MKTLYEINEILQSKHKELVDLQEELLKPYEGKEIIIPRGKLKGRKGVLKGIHFWEQFPGSIIAQMLPYRLKGGKKEDFPHYDDTRTYQRVRDEDLVKE